MVNIPEPAPEINSMLEELAGFVVARKPMSSKAKNLLEAALTDQHNQIKLVFAALASSKINRMSRLTSAVDILQEKVTDPVYITNLGNNPEELRKHLQLLMSIEEGDQEFLKGMIDKKAEDKGFSQDPRIQFNQFFGAGVADSVLPTGIDKDARRNMIGMLERLMSMVDQDGKTIAPPKNNRSLSLPKIIDVEKGEN